MKQSELDKILKDHKKWLNNRGGRRASLHRADLSNANLRGASLHRADLSNANLRGADLYGAYLYDANLRVADLYGAYLYDANLRVADLRGADLRGAYLYGADLYGADLYGADLSSADLRSAKGIIRVGPSLDGYEFFGVVRDGVTWIKAGCRWFTISDARKHWRETRGDTDLGKERLEFCDFIAKWGRKNGDGS